MSSKMMFYVLKRILLALLTIWIVITVTFFVMHAVPGGPFVGEKAITKEAQAALEAKYGLDKPLMEQYVTYLRDIVTKFDFGPSLKQRGRQVIDVILDGMRTSAKLGLIAAFSAAAVGIFLGAVAALRRNTVLDKVIMVITTAFVSMPSFIMGSFLLIVFSVKLGWLPANGATAPGLILPVITLALYPMSYITRLTRSSMLDVLGQDYIRTAKAKGLPSGSIYYKHAFKNVMVTVVTLVGQRIGQLIGGSVVIEQVFGWSGLGWYLYTSVIKQDYPAVQAIVLLIAAAMVLLNRIEDILSAAIYPRIKLD